MIAARSNVCAECGAALLPGESRGERFDRCLAKEFEDWAGYGAVHHLSVPAYGLQHPSRYSREGWLAMRRLLAGFLAAGQSPAQVRKQNRMRLDSGRRTWCITRGEPIAPPAGARWSKTVADVRMDSPDAYCAGVVAWAWAVLSDRAAWADVLDVPA